MKGRHHPVDVADRVLIWRERSELKTATHQASFPAMSDRVVMAGRSRFRRRSSYFGTATFSRHAAQVRNRFQNHFVSSLSEDYRQAPLCVLALSLTVFARPQNTWLIKSQYFFYPALRATNQTNRVSWKFIMDLLFRSHVSPFTFNLPPVPSIRTIAQ